MDAPSSICKTSPTSPRLFTTSAHSYENETLQYAQELLSTFSLAIGEVALQPSTGGTFVVTIHRGSAAATTTTTTTTTPAKVLWDRKVDGGFPETKELKRRVRDVIEPGRNLGHVDRDHPKPAATQEQEPKIEKAPEVESGKAEGSTAEGQAACEDCR